MAKKKKETIQEIMQPPENKLTAALNNPPAAAVMPPQPSTPSISTPEVIRNEKGGIIGLKTPSGDTIMGSSDQLKKMAAIYAQQQAPIPGTIEQSKSQQQQQIAAAQQEIMQTQQPEQRNLIPQAQAGENIPLFGGTIGALQTVAQKTAENTPIAKLGILGVAIKAGWFKPKAANTPEELQTVAKTQIEQKIYKQGITSNEAFGSAIEAIPVVGSVARRYAVGLQTPGKEVDELMGQLTKQKQRARSYNTAARKGIAPDEIYQNLDAIDLDIQRLESKIKLLITISPQLRSNPEEIQKIEDEIYNTRNVIFQAKINAMNGKTAVPTEYDLYAELEDLST